MYRKLYKNVSRFKKILISLLPTTAPTTYAPTTYAPTMSPTFPEIVWKNITVNDLTDISYYGVNYAIETYNNTNTVSKINVDVWDNGCGGHCHF